MFIVVSADTRSAVDVRWHAGRHHGYGAGIVSLDSDPVVGATVGIVWQPTHRAQLQVLLLTQPNMLCAFDFWFV